MKSAVAILCLLACSANAEQVTVDGYGETFDSALKNAKVAAVEKVTGTWINSQNRAKDGKVSEDIAQYNGGVIKTYKVLSYVDKVVTIEADVDVVKDNRVASRTGDVPQELRDSLSNIQDKRNAIAGTMKYLNNKSNAFGATVTKVDYVNRGDSTRVTLYGTLSWSPKWVSDLETLHQTIGQQSFDKTDKLVCITSHMGNVGADESCVPSDGLTKFKDGIFVMVTGLSNGKSVLNRPFHIESKMYEKFWPGHKKINTNFMHISYRYENETVVIYKSEQQNFMVTFDVATNDLKQVEMFEFKLQ